MHTAAAITATRPALIHTGPVIRAEEQLVIIVDQVLVNEAAYKKLPKPRVWTGCMEIGRREFRTYADIAEFALQDEHVTIRKVLRICMASGNVEDITDDVLDAAALSEGRA
jgi:hypothetical protein